MSSQETRFEWAVFRSAGPFQGLTGGCLAFWLFLVTSGKLEEGHGIRAAKTTKCVVGPVSPSCVRQL